eukprot:COSAG01_NODE_14227_length_1480_cov_5.099203_2_plen_103_part_00
MSVTSLILLLPAAAHSRIADDDFIANHNADPASTWVAGRTPFSGMSVDEFGGMFGDTPLPTSAKAQDRRNLGAWPLQATWERMVAQNTTFPDWFDPRYRWSW